MERAGIIARQADVVATLTLEVLKGSSRAFDSEVHKIRNHKGQGVVARRLRSLLHSETYPSEIARKLNSIQFRFLSTDFDLKQVQFRFSFRA